MMKKQTEYIVKAIGVRWWIYKINAGKEFPITWFFEESSCYDYIDELKDENK